MNLFYSQDATQQTSSNPTQKFTLNKEQGLTEFVVTICDGKTKEELYKKTVEWINKTYNQPSKVIKAQVENDYIRFQGIKSSLLCWDTMGVNCNDIQYDIEISFKDGKYKFSVLLLKFPDNLNAINFSQAGMYFKSDGSIRGIYKKHLHKIPEYFDDLNKSLYDYIYNQNQTAKQNDW